MLDKIIENTQTYIKVHDKVSRRRKSQFFTSKSVAEFMAEKASYRREHLSILEPGAGNGLLTAAVVRYCMENGLCNSFSVRFVENDPDILPVLNETISLMKAYVLEHHGMIEFFVSTENYILSRDKSRYDIVICNPPYKKIRKDSAESKEMHNYVYGQPNLYGLFMCKAVCELKTKGRFLFITPRSWTSGAYFKLVRECILAELDITDLLLFGGRDNVFKGEDVLQETMITAGVKARCQTEMVRFYIAESCFSRMPFQMEVPEKLIKGIGEDSYLLLPESKEGLQVIRRMSDIPDTFESLGYCFKTGPVVEYRDRLYISEVEKSGYVPMYRMINIKDGDCVFPANTEKAQYADETRKGLMVLNKDMLFVRRLTSKEERRRIQSCVYYKKGKHKYISIENHVNYLVRSDGMPLTVDELEWLNKVLSSDDYDIYYRVCNGSTQVNAGELNKMPLQRNDKVYVGTVREEL